MSFLSLPLRERTTYPSNRVVVVGVGFAGLSSINYISSLWMHCVDLTRGSRAVVVHEMVTLWHFPWDRDQLTICAAQCDLSIKTTESKATTGWMWPLRPDKSWLQSRVRRGRCMYLDTRGSRLVVAQGPIIWHRCMQRPASNTRDVLVTQLIGHHGHAG